MFKGSRRLGQNCICCWHFCFSSHHLGSYQHSTTVLRSHVCRRLLCSREFDQGLIHAQEEPSRVRSWGVCSDNEVENKKNPTPFKPRGCRVPQTWHAPLRCCACMKIPPPHQQPRFQVPPIANPNIPQECGSSNQEIMSITSDVQTAFRACSINTHARNRSSGKIR